MQRIVCWQFWNRELTYSFYHFQLSATMICDESHSVLHKMKCFVLRGFRLLRWIFLSRFANTALFSKIGLFSVSTYSAQLCEESITNWCALLVESLSHRSPVLFFLGPGNVLCITVCLFPLEIKPQSHRFWFNCSNFTFGTGNKK